MDFCCLQSGNQTVGAGTNDLPQECRARAEQPESGGDYRVGLETPLSFGEEQCSLRPYSDLEEDLECKACLQLRFLRGTVRKVKANRCPRRTVDMILDSKKSHLYCVGFTHCYIFMFCLKKIFLSEVPFDHLR